ncbi:hypothetical protein BaRGS_00034029 [Batillaria attramentaria]|uniref:C2H2-type domain-containing protein n=1 Tax=Batillaria attramentaria TaxID=370345 RepID=A0ABD0JJ96_9CAEN
MHTVTVKRKREESSSTYARLDAATASIAKSPVSNVPNLKRNKAQVAQLSTSAAPTASIAKFAGGKGNEGGYEQARTRRTKPEESDSIYARLARRNKARAAKHQNAATAAANASCTATSSESTGTVSVSSNVKTVTVSTDPEESDSIHAKPAKKIKPRAALKEKAQKASSNVALSSAPTENSVSYRCVNCSNTFSSVKDFEAHFKSHTLIPQSDHGPAVPSHQTDSDTGAAAQGGEKTLLRCPEPGCPAAFETVNGLHVHRKIHRRDGPFRCFQCSASFTNMNNWSRHRLLHRAAMPHCCSQCPAAFTQKEDLVAHTRTHLRFCLQCPAMFTQEEDLVAHTKAHKNYCSQCPAVFTQEEDLAAHSRTHIQGPPAKLRSFTELSVTRKGPEESSIYARLARRNKERAAMKAKLQHPATIVTSTPISSEGSEIPSADSVTIIREPLEDEERADSAQGTKPQTAFSESESQRPAAGNTCLLTQSEGSEILCADSVTIKREPLEEEEKADSAEGTKPPTAFPESESQHPAAGSTCTVTRSEGVICDDSELMSMKTEPMEEEDTANVAEVCKAQTALTESESQSPSAVHTSTPSGTLGADTESEIMATEPVEEGDTANIAVGFKAKTESESHSEHPAAIVAGTPTPTPSVDSGMLSAHTESLTIQTESLETESTAVTTQNIGAKTVDVRCEAQILNPETLTVCNEVSPLAVDTNAVTGVMRTQPQESITTMSNFTSETHRDEPFKCLVCSASFPNKSALSRHKQIHKGAMSHSCSQCSSMFTLEEDLIAHSRTHLQTPPTKRRSSAQLSDGHSVDARPFTYKCMHCLKLFGTITALDSHWRTHGLAESLSVPACASGTQSRMLYKFPVLLRFPCPQCSAISNNLSSLLSHLRNAHPDRGHPLTEIVERTNPLFRPPAAPLTCPEPNCPATFRSTIGQKKHRIVHTRNERFKCPFCSASFSRGDRRNRHIQLHNKPTDYDCSQSSSIMTLREDVVEHTNAQTSVKVAEHDKCVVSSVSGGATDKLHVQESLWSRGSGLCAVPSLSLDVDTEFQFLTATDTSATAAVDTQILSQMIDVDTEECASYVVVSSTLTDNAQTVDVRTEECDLEASAASSQVAEVAHMVDVNTEECDADVDAVPSTLAVNSQTIDVRTEECISEASAASSRVADGTHMVDVNTEECDADVSAVPSGQAVNSQTVDVRTEECISEASAASSRVAEVAHMVDVKTEECDADVNAVPSTLAVNSQTVDVRTEESVSEASAASSRVADSTHMVDVKTEECDADVNTVPSTLAVNAQTVDVRTEECVSEASAASSRVAEVAHMVDVKTEECDADVDAVPSTLEVNSQTVDVRTEECVSEASAASSRVADGTHMVDVKREECDADVNAVPSTLAVNSQTVDVRTEECDSEASAASSRVADSTHMVDVKTEECDADVNTVLSTLAVNSQTIDVRTEECVSEASAASSRVAEVAHMVDVKTEKCDADVDAVPSTLAVNSQTVDVRTEECVSEASAASSRVADSTHMVDVKTEKCDADVNAVPSTLAVNSQTVDVRTEESVSEASAASSQVADSTQMVDVKTEECDADVDAVPSTLAVNSQTVDVRTEEWHSQASAAPSQEADSTQTGNAKTDECDSDISPMSVPATVAVATNIGDVQTEEYNSDVSAGVREKDTTTAIEASDISHEARTVTYNYEPKDSSSIYARLAKRNKLRAAKLQDSAAASAKACFVTSTASTENGNGNVGTVTAEKMAVDTQNLSQMTEVETEECDSDASVVPSTRAAKLSDSVAPVASVASVGNEGNDMPRVTVKKEPEVSSSASARLGPPTADITNAPNSKRNEVQAAHLSDSAAPKASTAKSSGGIENKCGNKQTVVVRTEPEESIYARLARRNKARAAKLQNAATSSANVCAGTSTGSTCTGNGSSDTATVTVKTVPKALDSVSAGLTRSRRNKARAALKANKQYTASTTVRNSTQTEDSGRGRGSAETVTVKTKPIDEGRPAGSSQGKICETDVPVGFNPQAERSTGSSGAVDKSDCADVSSEAMETEPQAWQVHGSNAGSSDTTDQDSGLAMTSPTEGQGANPSSAALSSLQNFQVNSGRPYTRTSNANLRIEYSKLPSTDSSRQCPAVFLNISELRSRRKLHSKKGDRRAVSSGHTHAHSVSKPLHKCRHCPATFETEPGLKIHIQVHGKDGPYKCSMCPASFLTKHGLSVHRPLHEEEQLHIFPECSAIFTCQKDLESHAAADTGSAETGLHKCSVCSASFPSTSELDVHSTGHEEKNVDSCSQHPAQIQERFRLKEHAKNHRDPHLCHQCSSTFASKSALRMHTTTHTDQRHQSQLKTQQKKQCERPRSSVRVGRPSGHQVHSNTKAGLKTRGARRSGKKLFQCPSCHKSFFSKSGLAVHHCRRHDSQKLQKCAKCFVKFSDESALQIHAMKCCKADTVWVPV